MDNREAIKWLKAWSATHQNDNDNIREAVWCAINAIEELERRDKYLVPVKDREREELEQYRELGTLEQVREAVEKQKKYETQWLDDINNPLEPLKLSSALQSEIFKLEYRKENKPKEISTLDYTVIYALKDCLERYS